MREELVRLWTCLIRPRTGFAAVAARGPRVRDSLGRLLAWRLPLAFLHAWLAGKAFLMAYAQLRDPDGAPWRQATDLLPGAPSLEDLKATLAALPPAPAWDRCWPWLLLLVPLGLLGLWLHDAAWDHAGLWLLRGLKPDRKGRVAATLGAEAEALAVGSV
ncbi:MAG TPA: hypothetical protein VJ483_04355, partial [Holophagaceae bacterium]|nr:hypothetical protein [Holophagaceae bacterium]